MPLSLHLQTDVSLSMHSLLTTHLSQGGHFFGLSAHGLFNGPCPSVLLFTRLCLLTSMVIDYEPQTIGLGRQDVYFRAVAAEIQFLASQLIEYDLEML